jgi:hypothetical protein
MDELGREALRYLGYGNNACDEATRALIDACFEELKTANKAHAYGVFELGMAEGEPDDQRVTLRGGGDIKSKSLRRHFDGCRKVAVMCATLGSAVDYMLLRYGRTDVRHQVVLHACAAAAIEAYCDEIEDKIRAEAKNDGFNTVSRFSPGYGDLSLEYQPLLLRLVQAEKRIGLTATESLVLVPSKSVTALIGFTPFDVRCQGRCESCTMAHCQFTRMEKNK